MTHKRLALGEMGEDLAVARLKKLGYRILVRNFKVRSGEIDIIADDGGTLAFVEVKTRSGRVFGEPAESITLRKKKQLVKVAREYLLQRGLDDIPARFDVVSIVLDGTSNSKAEDFELIRNAFEVGEG